MLGFRNIILTCKELIMEYKKYILYMLNTSTYGKFQMYGMDWSHKILKEGMGLWLASRV